MRTTYFLTAAFLCLFCSVQVFAANHQQAKESYINDIPFETKQIFDSVKYQEAIAVSFSPKAEAFIEDIPFETEKIALQYLADSAMKINFQMPEEKTINDIPFNTSFIVRNQNEYLTNLKL